MGTYMDGKTSDNIKGTNETHISHNVTNNTNNTNTIDTASLIEAIAQAVKDKMGAFKGVYVGKDGAIDDGFNDEETMKKLAESMVVKRGDNESNFEELGGTNISNKDENTDKTINLLRDLD